MNDTIPTPDPGDKTVPASPNPPVNPGDKTVPAPANRPVDQSTNQPINPSVPPVSSGMYGHGSHLLQSGLMLPPQSPGVLGVIGKYQVIKILGEGGMGQVVLAREPVTDSMVAIKLIKPEFLNKSWAVHRFLTEARHMFRMSHGSIIRVLDVSDRPEGPYFVMPFMAGGSLADKIKPGEPLPPETVLPVARAVAEALQHAHTRGITHRDLKPSNILLDAEGRAQLADFGLLRTFLNDTIIDSSQPQMEGTVPYMSPAVAAGKAEDTRCDIYAFGCLLYEMLTGQPPYQGPTVDAVLKKIQDGPPPPIRQLNPQAPVALTAIADHAMARELRDRYASMADVVAELERAAQGKEPIGTHGKVAAKPKNKKAMIVAGAVALVAAVAFGISRIPSGKTADNSGTTATTASPAPIPNGEMPPGTEKIIDIGGGVTIKLVWIPATTSETWKKLSGGKDYFLMGSPLDEIGRSPSETQRAVKLTQGFWLARTEVIQAQWEKVMDNNPSFSKGGDLPVENVSWDECQAFVDKLAVPDPAWKWEIPTDAQWEYACRAGTGEPFAGERVSMAWYSGNSDRKSQKVGTKTANPWGLFDMHGNVWEWCRDWYVESPNATNRIDPLGPENGSRRVYRGGASDAGLADCRAARRKSGPPEGRNYLLGFRLALNPVQSHAEVKLPTPVAWWPGDGNANDVIGKRKGVAVNGADYAPGLNGQAFRVNGKDQYFKVPHDPALTFTKGEAFTLEAWVYRTGNSLPFHVMGKRPANAGTSNYQMGYDKRDQNVPLNKWTHLVVVCPKTNTPSISMELHYMNGTLGSAQNLGARFGPNDADILIGCSGSYFGFAGLIDDLRIYDRDLSADGVKALYDAGSARARAWTAEADEAPQVPPLPQTGVLVEGPFSYTVKDGAVAIVKYTGPGGDVTIPEKIKGLPVTEIRHSAFFGCGVSGIVIPDGLTSIGEWAFRNCASLTKVTIPKSVISIGSQAFQRTPKLIEITVDAANPAYSSEDGVVFNKEKTSLVFFPGGKDGNYVIPKSVTSIAPGAFAECILSGVTIPAGVTSIGNQISGFGNATSIDVDVANPAYSSTDGVLFNKERTSIVSYPKGKAEEDYKIPDSVTNIGHAAFGGCSYLSRVTVSSSVTTIEPWAFYGCTTLTGVYFRGNAPSLGANAFGKADNATIYHLPTAKGWGKEFGGRPTAVWEPEKDAKPSLPQTTGATPSPLTEGPFTYTVKDGAVTIVKYTGAGGEVKIPEKINGLPVTEIGPSAFYNPSITRISLPAGLTRLGDKAFAYCTGLTHVEISSKVTHIGEYAFNCCYALTSITIPASVTSIGVYALSSCTSLATITLSDGLVSIGARAFNYCTGLRSITIPSSVTNIGGGAFLGCTKLTRVTIPANVTTIGPDPFCVCSAMVEIKVDEANPVYCSVDGVLFDKKNSILLQCPEGKAGTYEIPVDFTKIGPGAFDNCAKLTGVTVPNSVTEIGTNAFAGCTSLSSINIPASVSSIVGVPFSGCSALTSITVDAANPFYSSVEGVLFNKQKTVLIRCPGTKAGNYVILNGVTAIRVSAFADCPNLTGITIPETVTEMGIGAFVRCIGLTTITIPARVSQIYNDAFLGCDGLLAIKVDAAHPTYSSSEDGVLFSKDKTKLLRYPPGRVGSYRVPDGVTSIEDSAFIGCANLTEITIPDSVVQIGSRAFTGCARLDLVEIGKGLRSIGSYAFAPCSSLTSAMFRGDAPKGDADVTIFYQDRKAIVCYLSETKGWGKTFATVRTALWDEKLRYCYTTDKDAATLIRYIGPGGDVTIPDKIGGFPVVSIAESAFQNCTTLTSLTVPEGVKSIMGRAFDGCTGLTKVTLPASVISMGTYPGGQWNPFVNCPKLASITVAATNPAFRSNADGILFNKEMTALVAYPSSRTGSYTIPDSVTTVGLSAFEGCAELTEVKIHRGVSALGPYSRGVSNPFWNCPKLTSIVVDETNASFSSVAGVVFNKDRSALFCYPSGKAGAYTVPDGVTRIGESAFNSCPGLTDVTMPASLTIIGHVAFMNSGELAGVFFKGNAPGNVGSNAFQGANKATIYYLPATKGWGKEFGGRPTAVWEKGAKAEN